MNIHHLPSEILCEIIKNLDHEDLRSLTFVSETFNQLINYTNLKNVQTFHLRNIKILLNKNTEENLILNILKKPSLELCREDLSYLCETSIERNLLLVALFFFKNCILSNYKYLYKKAFMAAISKCDYKLIQEFLENNNSTLEANDFNEAVYKAFCKKNSSIEIIELLISFKNQIHLKLNQIERIFKKISENNQLDKLKILVQITNSEFLINDLLSTYLFHKIWFKENDIVKRLLEEYNFSEKKLYHFFIQSIRYENIEILDLFLKDQRKNHYPFDTYVAFVKSIEYGSYTISQHLTLYSNEKIKVEDLNSIFKNAVEEGKYISVKRLIFNEKKSLTRETLQTALKSAINNNNILILSILLFSLDYSSTELKKALDLAISKDEIFLLLKDHHAKKIEEEKSYFKKIIDAIESIFIK